MTDQEFNEIRKTFPWTAQQIVTPGGGLVRVINCLGQEVPIFTMTAFMELMTNRLAVKTETT